MKMLTPSSSRGPRVLDPVRPSAAALQRRAALFPVNRTIQVLQSGRAPAQLSLFQPSGAIDLR